MKTTTLRCLLVSMLFAAACADEERRSPAEVPDPKAPADAVATWDGGHVPLAEVEAALTGATATAPASTEEWQQRYREIAEEKAVERLLLAGVEDVPAAVEEESDEAAELHRDAVLDLYLRRELRPRAEITAEEVEGFYGDHPEVFHRAAQRFVWHIFRRHRDPGKPRETLELLRDLRRRAQGGETFRQLAVTYSDSETRLLGGRLGWIAPGRLPVPLEEIVFGLAEGEISEPIEGSGGALLFYVSAAVEEKSFTLDDVRILIRRRLAARRIDEQIAAAVADVAPTAAARILSPEELLPTLEKAPGDEVVLEVGDFRLDAATLRQLAAEQGDEEISWVEPGERLQQIYRRQADRQLLYLQAAATGFPERPEIAEIVTEKVRREGRRRLVRQRIEAGIRERIDRDRGALERFYADNAFLYQSPLRLKLRTLSLPLLTTEEGAMARLEEVRGGLAAGELTLDAAAERLGGRIDEIGWLDPQGLAALEPKVRSYLLELDGPGISIPFQLNRALHLIQVEERQEPAVLPLEEVADRVREDYYERFQQQLYGRWVEELLAEAGFTFHPAVVRQALGLDGGG